MPGLLASSSASPLVGVSRILARFAIGIKMALRLPPSLPLLRFFRTRSLSFHQNKTQNS